MGVLILSQASRSNLKTVSFGALFLASSVIISIVESISGINALIPVPGVKLGLCNVAITACLYICGKKAAFAAALLRPLFLFLFSSNPVSLTMSFCGGMLSYFAVAASFKLYGKVFSFCGISCISAVCHAVGQTLAAMLLMGDSALLMYLPVFAALSSVMGTVCGAVMNIVIPRLKNAMIRAGGV